MFLLVVYFNILSVSVKASYAWHMLQRPTWLYVHDHADPVHCSRIFVIIIHMYIYIYTYMSLVWGGWMLAWWICNDGGWSSVLRSSFFRVFRSRAGWITMSSAVSSFVFTSLDTIMRIASDYGVPHTNHAKESWIVTSSSLEILSAM